jgi:hypothetical protein
MQAEEKDAALDAADSDDEIADSKAIKRQEKRDARKLATLQAKASADVEATVTEHAGSDDEDGHTSSSEAASSSDDDADDDDDDDDDDEQSVPAPVAVAAPVKAPAAPVQKASKNKPGAVAAVNGKSPSTATKKGSSSNGSQANGSASPKATASPAASAMAAPKSAAKSAKKSPASSAKKGKSVRR